VDEDYEVIESDKQSTKNQFIIKNALTKKPY
jgi:hypothetical protein